MGRAGSVVLNRISEAPWNRKHLIGQTRLVMVLSLKKLDLRYNSVTAEQVTKKTVSVWMRS